MKNSNHSIGVFDSGIGGLTVVKRIESFLPNEKMIYFGDTARVPYGTKSNATVVEYSIQDANFLISKDVKIIVVACNTASSVALSAIEDRFNLPVIGMIEPGSELALNETRNGKIGVIGTNATINNKAYSKQLKKQDKQIKVFEKACPLFVPLAEEGWTDHEVSFLVAEEYLNEFKEIGIDTLVLGCTHYPLLADVIHKVLGNNVSLIDSGTAASIQVKKYLEKNDLSNIMKNKKVQHEFYVSDLPDKFRVIAERFMGRPIKKINKVDLEEIINL